MRAREYPRIPAILAQRPTAYNGILKLWPLPSESRQRITRTFYGGYRYSREFVIDALWFYLRFGLILRDEEASVFIDDAVR